MTSSGIVRARIFVLMVMGVVIGAGAGGIFDEFQWPLMVAPLVPALAMIVFVERSVALRIGLAALANVVSVAVAVLGLDGSIAGFVDSFTAGPQRLLSTEWPSPVRVDLVGTIAALLATAVVLSAELARRRRWHLTPLAPLLVVAVIVVGLSAPLGVRWSLLVAMGATSVVFATLRDDDDQLRHRLRLLLGERRLVPLLLVAAATTALVSVPISLEARADPRRNDAAQQTAPLLDPIEATNALRSLDPPIVLHGIDTFSADEAPMLWRTAALENYDGVRWTPDLTLRPIGKTLGPPVDPVITYDVSFLDDNTSLVPFPGSPVSVDAAVETDPERTVVRLIERPTVGDVVTASATGAPTSDDAVVAGLAVRVIDDGVSGLSELAQQLGGDETVLEQLRQIESTMRFDWELDSEVQGGGLQQVLIERFLRETRRGNTEQFAVGFVLLARSLGVDARVATGFRTDVSSSTFDIESADATVWPEVRLNDGRWLPFEPVPLEEVSGGEPPPPEPQVQTPAAPQPPIPPPPEPSNDAADTDPTEEAGTTSALSTAITWAFRGGIIVGVALLPLLLAAGAILGVKYRRRRRRLSAATSQERIRGAWATATDALVDAGLSIGDSSTDAEIAGAGEPLVATARRPLHRLALLATAATFGTPAHPELLADESATCLETVETMMADDRSRWQRLRWRLSLRSLRAATRSPVTG